MPEHILETRGAKIHCVDAGTGATVFLMLHYWGGSARTWSGVVAPLSEHYRCIAIDQRGWSRSVALDGRYDLDAMADDVEDVATAIGAERTVLVGHSMGGKVAQIVAARNRVALAGLVLVGPAPPQAMPVPAQGREAMLASYQTREGVEQAIGILAGRPLTDTEREMVVADTMAGAPEAKRAWTESGMIAEVDGDLRRFAGPVTVLVGSLDRVEQPDALRAAFAGMLPQATIETIADVGHLLPIEAPQAIVSACRDILSL